MCTKQTYVDQRQAELAVRAIKGRLGKETRYYKCPQCGKFHVTTQLCKGKWHKTKIDALLESAGARVYRCGRCRGWHVG
jgi:DNA-directed RNA polymerase subunit RPC12/RpoP